MSDAGETPDYWSEVIDLPLASKADARRIVKLCRNGEFMQTYKPKWSTYKTAEGRILLADFERAQDILMGVSEPDAGRPVIHDWELIEELVYEVAEEMPKPVIQTKLREEVSRRYKERHPKELTLPPDTGKFKAKVREWLSE